MFQHRLATIWYICSNQRYTRPCLDSVQPIFRCRTAYFYERARRAERVYRWYSALQNSWNIEILTHGDQTSKVIKFIEWGHRVRIWGQKWPLRSYGGRYGLRGHQKGCSSQHTPRWQGNWGCLNQIWGQTWFPWLLRLIGVRHGLRGCLLDTRCTWISG